MLGVAHAGTAVLPLDRDAEDAEITELAPQIGGKIVVVIDGRGTRRDLVGGKVAHRAAQHFRGLAEAEIQAGQVVGGHRSSRAGRSEEHTSELQSLMRISYAVFCLKKKKHIHREYVSRLIQLLQL